MCVDGVEMTASANASAEVCGAGGVDTGGATVAVAGGAEMVVLESTTGTADDLCALGTLWNVFVVGLSSMSSASSCSFSKVARIVMSTMEPSSCRLVLGLCYLLSLRWFSLEEESVMQQSSISISLVLRTNVSIQ